MLFLGSLLMSGMLVLGGCKGAEEKPAKKTTKKKVDKKEKIEIMNGDPTVVTPVEEVKIEQEVLEAVVDQDPPLEEELEVMNGDPTVVVPEEDEISKMQMEALTATVKDNKENKDNNPFTRDMIGYSWNGMEMDTY